MKIARDLGYEKSNKDGAINYILKQAKSYRFNVGDLQKRYDIKMR